MELSSMVIHPGYDTWSHLKAQISDDSYTSQVLASSVLIRTIIGLLGLKASLSWPNNDTYN
jgi:hypothetical protein